MSLEPKPTRPATRWDWLQTIGVTSSQHITSILDTGAVKFHAQPDAKHVKETLVHVGWALHKAGVQEEPLTAVLKGLKQYHGINNMRNRELAKAICNPQAHTSFPVHGLRDDSKAGKPPSM